MKNWKNVCLLIKFYISDSLHGFLNRPFFKKRRNIVLLVATLFISYCFYFLLNMQQLASINNLIKFENNNIETMVKETFSSFIGMFLIISVVIYLFINSTLRLTRVSIFISKSLPFSEKEVWLSEKVFKIICGYFLFSLIIIIIVPAVKLITTNYIFWILLIIDFNILYIIVFLLLDLAYLMISIKYIQILKPVMDLALIIVVSIYFFVLRFKVDYIVGHLSLNIYSLIIIVTILELMLFILSITITLYLKRLVVTPFFKSRFINIKLPLLDYRIEFTFPAIIRAVNYWYILLFIVTISLISFYYNSLVNTLQNLMFIFPMIGLVGISYSDSTYSFRKIIKIYELKTKDEVLTIVFVESIILLPTLLLSLYTVKNIDGFVFGLAIFISATILGFIFPKSCGNINETVTSVLLIIIILLLSFLLLNPYMIYISIIVLTVILYFIVRREQKDEIA